MKYSDGVSRSQKVSSSPLDGDDDEDDQPSAQIPQASYSKQTRTTIECMDQHSINFDLIVQLLENLCFNNPNLIPFSAAILVFMPSLESIRKLADSLDGHPRFGTNEFRILPLHSMISNDNQGLVFNIPPQGVSTPPANWHYVVLN
jgi:ATP-dependent RNA helicase DHX29